MSNTFYLLWPRNLLTEWQPRTTLKKKIIRHHLMIVNNVWLALRLTVATYPGTIWYTTVNAQQKLSNKQSFSQLLTPYNSLWIIFLFLGVLRHKFTTRCHSSALHVRQNKPVQDQHQGGRGDSHALTTQHGWPNQQIGGGSSIQRMCDVIFYFFIYFTTRPTNS